jgi:class 3 adenylate cyclase/putative methionine-R-sulfoxide reductase with GAF domain
MLLAAITSGVPGQLREVVAGRDFSDDRGSAMGRALVERAPVHIHDVLADPEYTMTDVQALVGFRTILGVPLMGQDAPVGVLSVWRTTVDPFSDAEIRLVSSFAEQAAIAIRLARLLGETREALDRESAIGQVLASIARSSFDLTSVLNAVTESAARLTHADSGNLALIEGEEYRIAAAYGERSAELKRIFEESRITLNRGSMAGRVTLERRTIQIPDVLADPEYQQLKMQEVVGFRTLLGVPLMRDGKPRGVLMMQRVTVQPFTDQEIALITTFADQAALAIANVELYETVERQRADLASFAPHVAGLLSSPGGEALLAVHRREISALFCDLRGFTAFAETAEPEELFSVLREYHAEVGRITLGNGGTVEHFAGDGFMIFFNDPTPVADHPMAAVRTALTMHEHFADLAAGWRRRGYDLGLGIGISVGFATLGRIGFEGRYDYAGVGAVTNLAARLSSAAAAGETLVSQRMLSMIEDAVTSEAAGDLGLKGFSHPVPAFRVTGLRSAGADSTADPVAD